MSYGLAQQTRELTSPDYLTLVMASDAILGGYAQVRRQTPPACVVGLAPIELHRFYVDRPWQGQGVAQRLMEGVHAAAAELGGQTVWLSVWERNPRAIAFYSKCGFQDVGSAPFFVGPDRQTDRILVMPVARPAGSRPGMARIISAASRAEVEMARTLIAEYAESLPVDLSFQQFTSELDTLPGDYQPPRGALLLAFFGDEAVGCVGLRPLEWPRIAEMKRLFVRSRSRGHQIGLQLVRAALSVGSAAGYQRVRLDTLPSMTAARELYERLGFYQIDGYRFNPVEGTRYYEIALDPLGQGPS